MIAHIKDFLHKAKTDIDLLLLGLLIFALPFERLPSRDVLGITIRASLIIGAILITRVVYLLLTKKLKFKWCWLYVVVALFAGWVLLIVPESINIKRGLQVAIFDGFVIMVCVAVSLVYKKEYLNKLIALLLLSATMVSIFAFYQFFGDIAGLPGYLTGVQDRYNAALFGFPRVQAASLEPLYFGSYLLLPTMAVLSMLLTKDQSVLKSNSQVALIVLFSTIIFMTVARGAILGLVVGFIALGGMAIIKKFTNLKRVAIALGLLVVGFLLALLMINYVSKIPMDISKTFGKKGGAAFTQQLTNTGLEGGGDERAKSRAQALKVLSDNKSAYILGIGPGQFGPYVANNQPGSYGWTIVNNLTLELLVETGIVGLGLIVLFFAGTFYEGFRFIGRKKVNLLTSSMALALLAYFASQALQFQTFSTLYIMQVWVTTGLLLGIIFTAQRKISHS